MFSDGYGIAACDQNTLFQSAPGMSAHAESYRLGRAKTEGRNAATRNHTVEIGQGELSSASPIVPVSTTLWPRF